MQQLAADTLGLAAEKVTVKLGDTRLPASRASIGSATMANAGASVMLAAKSARDRAIDLALTGRNAPFAGAARDDVLVSDGRLMLAKRNPQITYTELLARNGLATLVGDGDYDPVEETNGPKAVFSFVGRRAGAARAVGDRSGPGPLPQPQLFRLPRTDECGYPAARDALRWRVRRGSEPTRSQGARGAHRRVGGARDRQCRVSRDRQASARPADHGGKASVRGDSNGEF